MNVARPQTKRTISTLLEHRACARAMQYNRLSSQAPFSSVFWFFARVEFRRRGVILADHNGFYSH